MPQAGFEPTISAGEGRQTYALECVAIGTGLLIDHSIKFVGSFPYFRIVKGLQVKRTEILPPS
jgi:hypothetical protein